MTRRLDAQRVYNRLGWIQRDILLEVILAERAEGDVKATVQSITGIGGFVRAAVTRSARRLVERGLLRQWWVVWPCPCCPLHLTEDGRAVAKLVAMYEEDAPQ